MILAAVPVKKLSEAKSRLSVRLSPDERTALARALLEQTVAALRESGVVDRIALATPEPDLAAEMSAEFLPDRGSLNQALRGAVNWALGSSATGLLIVPGDLPLISASAVQALAEAAGAGPAVEIVATQDGGTGALLLTPPDVIPPAFGDRSFDRHLALARERAVPVARRSIDAFAYDLDTVEDLEKFGAKLSQPLS